VLTDSKNGTKSGRFKEILGSYDPRKTTDLLKKDRISYWLGQGVRSTGSVHNLLVTHGIVDAKKINVLPKKTAPAKEAPVAEATPAPVKEAPVAPEETATVIEAEPVTEPNPVVEAPIEETPAEPVA